MQNIDVLCAAAEKELEALETADLQSILPPAPTRVNRDGTECFSCKIDSVI